MKHCTLYDIIPLFFLTLMLGVDTSTAFASEKLETRHKISVSHPGKDNAELPEITLVALRNEDNIPDTFYTEVVSVYCSSDVCKIDTVIIYWDQLGRYIRFQTAPGIELEKAGGEIFSDEDNILLHHILKDNNSPFKSLRIEEIVSSDLAHGIDVDAYTGATTIEFEEGVSVGGAALTCYTLWHWVHGDLVEHIQNITGDALSETDLRQLLKRNTFEEKIFALQQLIRREFSSKETQQVILEHASYEQAPIQELVLNYIEQTSADDYFSSIEKLFDSGNAKQRVIYLNSLLITKKTAPDGYYEKLSTYLPKLESYQEVNLLLSLMETKNYSSMKVNENAILLLKEDVFKARRAYWFLSGQDLNKDQQKVTDRFFRKNKDYL